MGVLEGGNDQHLPCLIDMGRGNTPATMNEDSRSSRVSPISINNGDLSPSQNMGNMRTLSFMNSGKRGRKTDREREEAGGRREWNDNEISTLIALWSDNDILHSAFCVFLFESAFQCFLFHKV